MNKYLRDLTAELVEATEVPEFIAGDTITVHYKIKEGEKERIQQFQGVVLQRKGTGKTATFTVRKMSNGIGVERVFPIASPFIDKIEVNKAGKVRRARIFYLRERTGKSARIQERRNAASATAAADAKAAKAKAKAERVAAEQEKKAAKKAEAKKKKTEATAKKETAPKAESKPAKEEKAAEAKPAVETKAPETKPAADKAEDKKTETDS